ncbi:hypothetical protein BR93DRAFT_75342 [Coniochaeta sp. PMI_546]|nr:hypothetical protein BR93DRAFT_75342 [Coniochaeta sp. PMI_546]
MCVLDGAVRRLAGVFNCGPRRELRDTPTVCFVSCFFLWRFIADRIGRMSLVRRTGHAAFAGCMSRNNYRRSIFSSGRGAGRSLLDEGFCPLLGYVGSSDSAIMAYGVTLGTGSTGFRVMLSVCMPFVSPRFIVLGAQAAKHHFRPKYDNHQFLKMNCICRLVLCLYVLVYA